MSSTCCIKAGALPLCVTAADLLVWCLCVCIEAVMEAVASPWVPGPSCQSEAEESDIIVVWFPPLLADGVFLSERGPTVIASSPPVSARDNTATAPHPHPRPHSLLQEQNRISTIHFPFSPPKWNNFKQDNPCQSSKSRNNQKTGIMAKFVKGLSHFFPWICQTLCPVLTNKHGHTWAMVLDWGAKLAISQEIALKWHMKDACTQKEKMELWV